MSFDRASTKNVITKRMRPSSISADVCRPGPASANSLASADVMLLPGEKSDTLSSRLVLPITNVTAIVSPSARPRPSITPPITPVRVYGSTMRFYDPTIDAWRITWTEPGYGVITSLIGRKVGEEIVLEGKTSEGKQIHWIFSQIKPASFHWRAEKLVGDTWQIYEDLSARRTK